jgi:hypothetical protein
MSIAAKASAVQIKAEVTEGLDPGSWASGDVLAVSSVSETLNFDQQTLSEFGGSLDSGETVAGAAKPTITLRGALRGSGTPATPITPFSALMKASMFAETSQLVLPSTGTVTATAGTANTITILGTSGGGLDFPATTVLGQVLIGAVVELGGNPATPTTATIIGYEQQTGNRVITLSRNATDCGCVGAVFTTATTLKVLAGTMWAAASPSPQPSVYVRQFRGPGTSVMQSFSGCRSNYRQTVRSGGFAEFEFAVGGQFVGRSGVALPSAPTFLSPPVAVNASATFTDAAGGSYVGAKLELQEFSLDCGIQGQYPDDINQLTGVQAYLAGGRKITGAVNPLLTSVATRNLVTAVQNGTKGALVVTLGPKTGYGAGNLGNRFAWTVPTAKFLDVSISEDNVVLRESLNFEATSFDNGLRIYHY